MALSKLENLCFKDADDIFSKAFVQLTADLYVFKERCRSSREMEYLMDHLNKQVDALLSKNTAGSQAVALALLSQLCDSWYCKSGHEIRSASNDQTVTKCLDEGRQCAKKAINLLKELQSTCSTEYGEKALACAAVWVFGYSAMAFLVCKRSGKARDLLEKAHNSFFKTVAQVSKKIESVDERNLDPGSMLAAAFLSNSFGRYHRDADGDRSKDKAVTDFKKSLQLYKQLSALLGEPHFLHEVALMHVNIVRVLLGPLTGEKWKNVIPEQDLLDASDHLEEAKKVNARRTTDADRMAFRLLYFDGHLRIKYVLNVEQSLKRDENNHQATTDNSQKLGQLNSYLQKARELFKDCQKKFGDAHAELNKIEQLLEFIDSKSRKNRASASNVQDTSSTETDTKSRKGKQGKRPRTKSQAENSAKRRTTEESGTNNEDDEDDKTSVTPGHAGHGDVNVAGTQHGVPSTLMNSEVVQLAVPGTDKDCSESDAEKISHAVPVNSDDSNIAIEP